MRQSVSVARTSAVIAVSGGSSSPGSNILVGLLFILAGVVAIRFRSALWGGLDRRYLEKRAGRNKGPGFSYFLSTKVVPAGFILVGLAILASGIADL